MWVPRLNPEARNKLKSLKPWFFIIKIQATSITNVVQAKSITIVVFFCVHAYLMASRGSEFKSNRLKSMFFCIFLCLLDGLPRLEIQLKSIKIDVFRIFLCSLDGLPRLEIQLKSIKIGVVLYFYAYLMDSRGSKSIEINWNRCFLYILMFTWWTPEARNSVEIN